MTSEQEPIRAHLKPYEWTNKLEEQTITIVVNKNFSHPKQVIEAIEDFNKERFVYAENEHKDYESLFNTHGDIFYIGCRQVEPHVYVLVENNGYYANQEDNIARLSFGGEKDPDAVAISLFWNVNAKYYIYIGSAGKCIFGLDPLDMAGADMVENNEVSIDNFDEVWKWGKDIFTNENFQNMEHIQPSMLWLAEKVTGYRLSQDFYSTPFEHVGIIGTRKKRRTDEGPALSLATRTEQGSAVSCEAAANSKEELLTPETSIGAEETEPGKHPEEAKDQKGGDTTEASRSESGAVGA